MARRLAWTDPSFELVPYDTAELASSEASNAGNSKKDVFSGISGSDIVMAMGVHDAAHTAAALSYLQSARNALALDSAPSLEAVARVNGRNLPIAPGAKDSGGLHSLWAAIQAKISAAAHAEQQHVKALNAVRDLYLRRTSDDLVFSFLVFINEAVRAVPAVANSTKQANVGLPELQCMVTKCGGEIFGCLADATCRTALDCLNGCSYNDQVRCRCYKECLQESSVLRFLLCNLSTGNKGIIRLCSKGALFCFVFNLLHLLLSQS